MQKPISDVAIGLAKFWLHPLLYLLGEGTLRAVGVVLQTKVFVDLEQTLVLPEEAQELQAAWIVSKKSQGTGLDSAIR